MNTDTAPLTKLITLTLPGREGSLSDLIGVDCLAISPDGRYLAGASDDVNNKGEVFPIFLWSLPDGKLLRRLDGHLRPDFGRDGRRTAQLVFTPDSRSLISWGCDFTARVWDVQTGRCRQVLEYKTWVRAVEVDPGGELFAVWHETLPGRIRLYTLPDGRELHRDMVIGKGYGEGLAATADGQYWVGVTDQQVCIWRRDGQSHKVLTYGKHAFSGPRMAFSPDGATLYVAIADGAPSVRQPTRFLGHHVSIHSWRVPGGEAVRTFSAGHDGPDDITVSPDGTLIALTRERGKRVTLHDTATGRYLRKLDAGLHPWVTFSAGGRVLVAAGSGILLWSVSTGRLLRTISESFVSYGLTAVSRDRGLLAFAGNGRINVWSLADTMPCPACATPLDFGAFACSNCGAELCQRCWKPFEAAPRFRCLKQDCGARGEWVCPRCVEAAPRFVQVTKQVVSRPAGYVPRVAGKVTVAAFLALAVALPLAAWLLAIPPWVGIPAGITVAGAICWGLRTPRRQIPATYVPRTFSEQIGQIEICWSCRQPLDREERKAG